MAWLGAGTPCIGIAPLDVLMYKDTFVKAPEQDLLTRTGTGTGTTLRFCTLNANEKNKGLEVKYWKRDKPVPFKESAIDPNHTHFVFVSNIDKPGFGGEVEMRAAIE